MKKPDSMARQIRARLLWMGLLGTLLTALASALLFHQVLARNADDDLRRICSAVAAGYMIQQDPQPESLADLIPADEWLRFTLIQPDGSVLYDSAAAPGLENHLSRPEVQAALQDGWGRATRQSKTSGYETHYYALRLADGSVLRAADEEINLWGAYQEITLPFLECCVLMIVLALLFSTRLTRALVRPVNRMAEHLDEVAAYVPYEELLPFAAIIQSDQQLRENNEALRREFTANVSHELKTPLTSISGYAELIESGMAKPEDVPAMAGRIHKEASRMIALVSDIIQLTELDETHRSDAPPAELAPLDLVDIVKDVAAAMTVNSRKAYITLRCTAEPAAVLGSRDQLCELLTNLCDNAIRYNRPGGHVELRCGPGSDGSPTLTVEDNGIGIPESAQGRVFERFYRVDKSRSKATGGTGLGLAIVKHIAILHGARIELKSQVGTGTTIRVVFPKV